MRWVKNISGAARSKIPPVVAWFGVGILSISAFGFAFSQVFAGAQPSNFLLRALGAADITLLVAYSVTNATINQPTLPKRLEDERVGFICGIGFAGLLGAGAAFGFAEMDIARRDSFLPEFGFWFAAFAGFFLGWIVTLFPMFAYYWRRATPGYREVEWRRRVPASRR